MATGKKSSSAADDTRKPSALAHAADGPAGEVLLYRTEDGRTRVECRFADESLWLSQALMAELFQKDVRTINEHLKNLYREGELAPEATIRKFRIVRREGTREVARQIEHYNLDAILAVGYRVRSPRGTLFRQWATERLREYLVKGFTMDDERLKNPDAGILRRTRPQAPLPLAERCRKPTSLHDSTVWSNRFRCGSFGTGDEALSGSPDLGPGRG